jgi:hypothetical protein
MLMHPKAFVSVFLAGSFFVMFFDMSFIATKPMQARASALHGAQTDTSASPQTRAQTGERTRAKSGLSDPQTSPASSCKPRSRMSSADFELVLQTLREAWMAGNAQKAAECFTKSAIVSIPPSIGAVGRDNLAPFFGGDSKHESPRQIEWHHIVFDPAQQIGAVEYTIQRRLPVHGVVMIKLSDGLIGNWRQYAIASDMPWEKFAGINVF